MAALSYQFVAGYGFCDQTVLTMNKHVTIQRKKEEESLYTHLQERALKEVQSLAGEVWTDYNEHDPGVTILDILNYALLETDYRLQFGWQDYLSLPEDGFIPEMHALFAPSSVFTVNPVTATDYRKLLVAAIEGLSDVQVTIHKESGIYDFLLDVSVNVSEQRKEEIREEVCMLFHTHRNLCENLGEVDFLDYVPLVFCMEAEIKETENPDRVMADVYFEVQEFLRSGVRFRRVDELLAEGKTVDEILEGPEQIRMVIDEESMCTGRMEFDMVSLYQRMKEMQGICRIVSLSFYEGGQVFHHTIRRKSLRQAYTVIPFAEGGQTVILTKKGKQVMVCKDEVQRMLSVRYAAEYGAQNRTTDGDLLNTYPGGMYRDLFVHSPVLQDFPECYRESATEGFVKYLTLFDDLINSGLAELETLPAWMSPDMSELTEKKEAWMDILDRLYGEDSNPSCLMKYETDVERRTRRMAFLGRIPVWGRNRGKAMNWQVFSSNNKSGLEEYMMSLLNFEKYGIEIFLLEHSLFGVRRNRNVVAPEDAFRISVILIAGLNWLEDEEFRHACERLITQRTPAHIRTNIYWLEKGKAGDFRPEFLFWQYTLSTFSKTGIATLSNNLKSKLTHDINWYSKV